MLGFDLPLIDTGIDTTTESALAVVVFVYVLATLFNLRIPDTGAVYAHQERNPAKLIAEFAICCGHAVERQARPDLAGGDDAVLGRRRDLAVHRAQVGRKIARHAARQSHHA